MLTERSGIRPDQLAEQDNRIPLANYLALLQAGIESCREPALALLFGEAVRLPDISIVGLIGQSHGDAEDVRGKMNRYFRLALDADDGGEAESVQIVRENG